VNISEVKDPPGADAGPDQKVGNSDLVTLDGSRSGDLEGAPVSFAWTQIAGSPVMLSDPSSPQPTFIAPDAGAEGESLVFELTVTDADGLRSRDRCVVNVTWENHPPKADAGVNRKVQPGTLVTLDGSKSADDEDGIASYQWRQTAGKPVNLSDPRAISPTFTVPGTASEGEGFVFELTVIDAGGLQDKARVKVTVEGSP